MCPYPECSSRPLVVFAVCQASYQHPEQSYDQAFDTFFNFIFEDIRAMTGIDLDFNVYKEFVVETETGEKRAFLLEEILNNKLRVHAEVKAAIARRAKVVS